MGLAALAGCLTKMRNIYMCLIHTYKNKCFPKRENLSA